MTMDEPFNFPKSVADELKRELFSCIETIRARQGALLLLDRFGQELSLYASFGMYSDMKEEFPVAVGKGLAGRVAAHKKLAKIAVATAQGTLLEHLQKHGIYTYMAAPVTVEGDVIGVVELRNKVGREHFSGTDGAHLQEVIGHIAETIKKHEASDKGSSSGGFGKFIEGLHHLQSESKLLSLLGSVIFAACSLEAFGMIAGSQKKGKMFVITESPAQPAFVESLRARLIDAYRQVADFDFPEEGFESTEQVNNERADIPLTGTVRKVFTVPIRLARDVKGCFMFARNRPEVFSGDDRRIAVTMASALVTLLDHHSSSELVHRSYLSTVKALLGSAEEIVPQIRKHSYLTALYSKKLAQRLQMSEIEIEALTVAALLHDIGLRRVAPELLRKPTLTEEEREIFRKHPVETVEILSSVEFPYEVVPLIRQHHERWDGRGYPDGLQGESILLGARILSIAEAYSAMVTTMPFRAAKSAPVARQEISQGAGTQFDPQLAREFLLVLADDDDQKLPAV
ncbi:MAG: HD domain-containing protein [Candidatus Schekmanbacteria bacterium]|nr:HD domain-containing protein [Candidatus Schekmanbacteria bacterium]